MLKFTPIAAGLAIVIGSVGIAKAQLSSDALAAQDFKLTEIEPYYTRFTALTSCARSALASSEGSPIDRERVVFTLCQVRANDLRALLGAKIGSPRATKVIEFFRSQTVDALKEQEASRADADVSPDVKMAKAAIWSSGPWHLYKQQGICAAMHRYEGSTTLGGIHFAGGTIQDILFGKDATGALVKLYTPAAGHAHDLLPYAGKSVKMTFSAQPLDGGKAVLLSNDVIVEKFGDVYNINLDTVDGVDRLLTRFKQLKIEAINGNRTDALVGYTYDLRGLGDAIVAFRKCAG